MRSVSILVLCSVVALSEARVNYCGSKMCGHTNAHTFCQYSPGPGPQCTGYMDAELSADEKELILARLNQRRSAAASGRLRGLPTAGNMLKLRWVEELSREAQRWADQCRPPSSPEEHDLCRDLYSTSVGQCVASVLGEAPGLRPETMVDMWYMQSRHYRANVTAFQPSLQSNGYYGDFGQILWANAYMVGCGRSRFMTSWYGRLRTVERLVCNFAPRGPASGRALWTPAAPAAACPPRAMPDQELPPLCNFPETVRQLQEELERMENALSTPVSTAGKVRRELRSFPKEANEDDMKDVGDPERSQPREIAAIFDKGGNETDNRTPMLNMVLKYMPYLKDYQTSMMKSRGDVIYPSVTIMYYFVFNLFCV